MKEFIVLMAYLTALVALSIDAMLPALSHMAMDLQVLRHNDIQYVVGFIFIGMTIGQLFYGPLADAIGRKPALYSGLALFIAGSLLSWASESLAVMLVGRFLQGLGVSAPRIVTMAIVRDKYHGRDMAYVMSMVMGVFIMVPAIAPAIGQVIIHMAGWRTIFLFYIVAAMVGGLWAQIRLEETLALHNRRKFNVRVIWAGIREAAATRVTMGYTVCSGLAFGALLGYLNSAQQIFQELFLAGDRFALYFGLLALAIGSAFFANSAFVRKYGMRRITRLSNYALMGASLLFLPYVVLATPALPVFMLFAAVAFFCLGLMFGNMNAMALEPMGHMAGLASAFVGSGSSAISLALGTVIGQLYNGSLIPLAAGFLVLSIAAHFAMVWAEKGHALT